mgnify:CR=1 FL=1
MANDTWRTPPEVISFIENKFGRIMMDLCSSEENKICLDNLCEADDFLDDKWIGSGYIGQAHWCNPPYSNPLPFVKQCIKWAKHGYPVAGILNFDPSTKWYVELHDANALFMQIIGGRIAFHDEHGVPAKGNNKPQFMFYLAPFLAQSVQTEYINKKDVYK